MKTIHKGQTSLRQIPCYILVCRFDYETHILGTYKHNAGGCMAALADMETELRAGVENGALDPDLDIQAALNESHYNDPDTDFEIEIVENAVENVAS